MPQQQQYRNEKRATPTHEDNHVTFQFHRKATIQNCIGQLLFLLFFVLHHQLLLLLLDDDEDVSPKKHSSFGVGSVSVACHVAQNTLHDEDGDDNGNDRIVVVVVIASNSAS